MMLDNNQVATAARTLSGHWRAGTKLACLDTSIRPRDRADGYAIQAALATHSPGKLFGWKIAATSDAGQKHINVNGPLVGRVFAETVIADGGIASMKGNEMRVGEPEFAFRFARDLRPRANPYSLQAVLDAVGALHPAIEIPDSRFSDFLSAGEAQLIADNACAHLFVLGAATNADWRRRDLIEERPVITLSGRQYIGHGKNVLGDPRVALAWCVNELRALGITLREGEVVTTGTCHTPLPIQAGDLLAADFGVFGKVSVGFA
jgi:2-keto-4-pentenoate hydratase